MRTGADQRQKPEGEEDDPRDDGLLSVSDALAGYLEEIDAYWTLCLQHEETTEASITEGALHLIRRFHWTAARASYAESAVERLQEWRRSPFWRTDGAAWRACEDAVRTGTSSPGEDSQSMIRGISWEGRPILACVSGRESDRLLRVELILLPVWREMPELPLRTVADGLRCHAFLLPKRIALPLPCSTSPSSIRQLLSRAMPPNLYASQCFSLGSAEK